MLVDLAADAGVPLTRLAPTTVEALANLLPPELPPVNPLDAWSRGGENASQYMAECFSLLLQDPGAALGAVIHDRAPYGKVYDSYLHYLQHARAHAQKPVALVAARQGTGHEASVASSTRAGYPVLDGVRSFLSGVRALFAYRDFLTRNETALSAPPKTKVLHWRHHLRSSGALGEAESLGMLQDFGLTVPRVIVAGNARAVSKAAASLTYPLVLKTAVAGVQHKTEKSGVILNIRDKRQLLAAYARLQAEIGPEVLLAPMIGNGVEMMLGAKSDPQFGPVILLGFGGVLAETLGEVAFALPPFSAADARRQLDKLKLRPLLDGVRGAPPAAIDNFCDMAARFSAVVHELRDVIAEIDVNPVIVTPEAAIAVDALVVPK
jgi:acyl-CoA synthetase (NDP forming)